MNTKRVIVLCIWVPAVHQYVGSCQLHHGLRCYSALAIRLPGPPGMLCTTKVVSPMCCLVHSWLVFMLPGWQMLGTRPRTRWYSEPVEVVCSWGWDHIHRPLEHGLVVDPIEKPPVTLSSWFRRKLLPWRARPQTATTPKGPRTARSTSVARSPTSNFAVSTLYLTSSSGSPCTCMACSRLY